MAVYTVHEPPQRRYEWSSDTDRFVFVRDGFSLWAFLFAPLWMLRHRMWLVLLGYGLVLIAVEVALNAVHAPQAVGVTVGVLLGLLIGFEASTMRRFTLGRRKWTNVGVIVGDDLESAERRFFDGWVEAESSVPTPQPDGAPAQRMPQASSDVIGLFPDSGTPR